MSLERKKQLIDYLAKRPNQWVSAQKIADTIGVSTRQIRKYISAINESEIDFDPIKSGSKGYQLDDERCFSYKEKDDITKYNTPLARHNYIIQKLISSSQGYDVFDFCDELFVSLPTVEKDLKAVRNKLEEYELNLKRSSDRVLLEGEEASKRALMRNQVLPGNYDNFVLQDEIRLMNSNYHFWDIRKNIKGILTQDTRIFTNDYSLNNITLHSIVMVDRIKNGGALKQSDKKHNLAQNIQYSVAEKLADYFCHTYNIAMSDVEIYYLAIIVTINTTIVDVNSINMGNIDLFIDKNCIDFSKKVFKKVERSYSLDPFDNEFIARFIVHMNNMFIRMESGYHIRNPLKMKMKTSFPLIYDIAVFIAQEIKNEYDLHLTEDEIAFIALHIGGCFEKNFNKRNKVTCIFIYTDYYDSYMSAVSKIEKTFSDTLTVKHVISLNQYKTESVIADLIISAVDMEFCDRHIIINPFLKETDIVNIRNAITNIMQKNRFSALKAYLFNFVSAGVFYKNPSFIGKNDAIITMTQRAIQLGYANESLTENVLQREMLSDTTFYNVAVPHSLQDDAIKSFISFAISENPVKWGNKQVNIIVLIGVNKDTRKIFTDIFDLLIEILSESKNVKELAAAADYEDFHQKLILQIERLMC